MICGFCGKKGHAIYNCRFYFAQNNQQQDQRQNSNRRNFGRNQNASNQPQQHPVNIPNQQFPVRSNQRKSQEN